MWLSRLPCWAPRRSRPTPARSGRARRGSEWPPRRRTRSCARRSRSPPTRAPARVVMSMGPRQLPSLADGDRLELSAELQLTTDCVVREPRCAGMPYRYSPVAQAQLVLAANRRTAARARALPLGRPQREVCGQRPPHREHHCVIVFDGVSHEFEQGSRRRARFNPATSTWSSRPTTAGEPARQGQRRRPEARRPHPTGPGPDQRGPHLGGAGRGHPAERAALPPRPHAGPPRPRGVFGAARRSEE